MLNLDLFYKMVKYRRPAGGGTERRFISLFLDRIPGMQHDPFGNRWLSVGEGEPSTMFSAHTDTMHTKKGQQRLLLDEEFGLLYADKSNCLGADDTTGIFIMLNLIDEKVPGLYVFHREEEIGGGGSLYFADKMIQRWPDIKRCIAFDRLGYSSIITHQMGERCASQEFSDALALELGAGWDGDDGGTFTDSANYTHIISECTNISVGYFKQHTPGEYQDVFFLEEVVKKFVKVEWDNLPAVRDPLVESENIWDIYDNEEFARYASKAVVGQDWDYDEALPQTREEVSEYLYGDPEGATDLICSLLEIKLW